MCYNPTVNLITDNLIISEPGMESSSLMTGKNETVFDVDMWK
jgi:hypothetical protein